MEIAALYVAEGQIQDRFVTLIQPCRPIAPEITRLTGITDDLVREAPEVEAVIGELVKFCGELPLLGHNISFDYSFLQQAAVNAGLKLPANVLDTLGLCRSFMRRESPKTSARPAPGTAFPRRRPTGPRRTPSALISFTRSSWDSTEWSGRSCLPPGRWKFV